jgi:hypothetical protein
MPEPYGSGLNLLRRLMRVARFYFRHRRNLFILTTRKTGQILRGDIRYFLTYAAFLLS